MKGEVVAYTITDECNLCDKCVDPCPNDAITEGDDIYIIDPNKCTECVGHFDTPQCADVCPVDSCITDPDREELEKDLLERAKSLHPDKTMDENSPSHFKS